jgi:hypothetical protein
MPAEGQSTSGSMLACRHPVCAVSGQWVKAPGKSFGFVIPDAPPYCATEYAQAGSSATSLLRVNAILAMVMVLLLAAAAAVCHFGRLGHTSAVVAAELRAAVQLTAVSVVIGVVVTHLPLLVLFVALMYAVAVRTCGRRQQRHDLRTAADLAKHFVDAVL